jgi:hypothetical protein
VNCRICGVELPTRAFNPDFYCVVCWEGGVMLLDWREPRPRERVGRFTLICRYDDRVLPLHAGFHFARDERLWWTTSTTAARQFSEWATSCATEKLLEVTARMGRRARASSRLPIVRAIRACAFQEAAESRRARP